ncbi:DUF1382 family protein [Endozoicomonas sp. GU-1]|uniref:DUF1382 family protein n=1 Tax=Endozoicomonas sp. GU-1 TaxID=3009078 RepID=UPI0022B33E6B|nr:DUF1382 family protein [Endozoicomonas sp. GU-1]WBA79591.1 DUF1382 family protein [Endozoicomonas sp. GU-1]
MERASPADLRKSLEIVEVFKSAGIMFVPVPVASKADHDDLIAKVFAALAEMKAKASE